MSRRWPLLALTALAAGASAVGGAMTGNPDDGRFARQLREDIAARDRAAAARKRQLDLQEQAAQAIARRQPPVAAGPGPAPVAPPLPEQSEGERLDDLAKIYAAMKPKAAAPIFEQLSLEVQVKVAGRMRERSMAQIMAAMAPPAAARLTMAIAKRQTSYTVLSPGGSSPQAPAVPR